MAFASCNYVDLKIAGKQGQLKDCDGVNLAEGSQVPTCAQMNTAISNAVASSTVPQANDTVQGKVALNLGTSLPGDASNTTDALTASGVNTIMNDTSVAGGNAMQKAVVNAVEQAIGSDAGAQAAIANAIADDVAANLPEVVDDGLVQTNGTANGVVYLNGSKVATSGSALTFDGASLLVGSTSNIYDTTTRLYSTSSGFAAFFRTTAASGYSAATFSRDGYDGAVCQFHRTYNGPVVGLINVSSTSTAYNTSSDYRLKENIQPMTGALAKVAALKPCTYKWKADGSDGEGFIAHELAEVCPAAVTGEKDDVDAEGKPVYQGIDTSFLAGLYAAALQELMAEVNSLKAEIAALKA